MITDEELLKLIESKLDDFEGDLDEFNQAVGMLVVGRLTGWEVQRLVCSRVQWAFVSKWLGDPKQMLPRRGRFSSRSVGLRIVDQIGDFWGFVRGHRHMPLRDRKSMSAAA